MPVTAALYAARNLAFKPVLGIEYLGSPLPLDGATITMEVRQYPGQEGGHLAGDIGVSASDAATPTDDEPTLRTLTLEPVIAKAALAALPGLNVPDAGDNQTFYQEIKVTYADAAQESLWIGEFIALPGVNAS